MMSLPFRLLSIFPWEVAMAELVDANESKTINKTVIFLNINNPFLVDEYMN
jgi:hypothetical protein